LDEEFEVLSNILPFTGKQHRPTAPVAPPTWETETDLATHQHLTQLVQKARQINYLITMGSMQLEEGMPPQFFTWIHPHISVSDLATASTLFQTEVISRLMQKK
jgi:hypothetical protein